MAGTHGAKRVINTHISDHEYKYLKDMAKKNGMTLTMYLRLLIITDMRNAGQFNNNLLISKEK